MERSYTTVSIKPGRLRGSLEDNIDDGSQYYAFKGIPYAKPPVKELRFRDPEPLEPWSGVRDALEYGGSCAQVDWIANELAGGDDCLYLNVYTNNMNPAKPRPVMLWIHGGGFAVGSADKQYYGADYLVQKDIVLVTINYRLNIFGFLCLDDPVATGNQGLKDQVMALKWVQENISAFGGDPNNVTIFGESAGAASVHYLCLSPLARGLFHKAIAQSGVASNAWAYSEDPTKYAYRICEVLGKKITDPKSIVEFLRSFDCKAILEALRDLLNAQEKAQTLFPFAPVCDTKSPNPFLPEPPMVAYKRGIKVPLLLGFVSNEGLLMLAGKNEKFFKQIDKDLSYALHPNVLKQMKNDEVGIEDLRSIYFKNGMSPMGYADLCGDLYFVRDIVQVATEQANNANTPTFLYKFTYEDQSLLKMVMNITLPGTMHGDDVGYLFVVGRALDAGIPIPEKTSTQYKVKNLFVQMWTDFAATGNPTPRKSELTPVTWLPLERGAPLRLLNINEEIHMESDLPMDHERRSLKSLARKNKL